jgi:hypothetical protein
MTTDQPVRMPMWQRAYAAVCCGMIGFAIAYVFCDWGSWPRLTYFPYERDWGWISGPPGLVPMNYLGTILWGVSGLLLGAASAWTVSGLFKRALGKRFIGLLAAWAITAVLYAGAYYTWNLWPF